MNYIISGGLGFIGKNLSIYLNDRKKEIMLLDKLSGCDLCKVDIRLPKCPTFVHLAAVTDIRKSIKNPKEVILDNSKMTLKCLEYAKEHNSHFIFTSSMGAPKALSPYSASKLACEAYCNAYYESYGVKSTILRLSNVYGPHSTHKNSVIAKFIKLCLNKEDLTIFGNGLQTRDFIHVDDVIRAILNCDGYKLVNVASGRTVPVLYIAECIRELSTKLTNFTPEITFSSRVKGEIDKTDTLSDFSPTILLEQGLEDTFKWYLEHQQD